MTVREILSAMLRRWYVSVGLLACVALVTVLLARDGGTYTTSTVVSFLRPAATSLEPYNGTQDVSIIAFAGSVAQETRSESALFAPYSTSDAPFHGAGIREGALVGLTNSGSQWVSTFKRSDIKIQIVGRSFDAVKTRQTELVDRVLSVSNAQQAALDVAPDDRITATVAPITLQIDYISPSRGGQLAAGAALLTAGLIVGAWGSIALDRRLLRRRISSTGTPMTAPSHLILKG